MVINMSEITDAFKNALGGKAFIPFITGGDPDMETSEKLIIAMSEAGADIIEIGLAFSDPIAEGPVIQEASLRANLAGATTDRLFDMIASVSRKISTPLIIMTYINPVFTYGVEKFLKRCNECGVKGLIVPDLPYEEKHEISDSCSAHGVDFISMIAPTSKERIKMIAREAEGFIYCVSSMGVTGMRSEINTDISGMVETVREVSSIPCAIGFGISNPAQAGKMANVSDGAIVGSAIVKIIAEKGRDSVPAVSAFVKEMKHACSGHAGG
jgi:tryptophan synthase alpha chain